MKRAIIAIFLISLIPVSTSGQMPNPEIQWTADWSTEDEVAIMELDEDTYSFELILEFWINNNRLTPIEVGFEVEFEDVEFSVDDPGQATVEGNSNKTFELKISGSGMDSDGILYNADTFSETVTMRLIELIAGQAADSSREIEMVLEFSKIYNLVLKYQDDDVTSSEVKMPMKSGTTKTINLQVFNYGNTDDAVTKTSIAVSRCPQLDYSFEPVSALPIVVNPALNSDESKLLGELEVSTTTSHPTKECILEFTIYPESDSTSSYATLTIDVESVETIEDKPDDNTDDTSNTDTTDLEVESSSLPAISSFLCILTVLFSAVIRRNP
ncbi:MAG: hypothetical protein VXX17_00520 [Candidatus Thermoplasmatota archaeon]|nr:hypothetical protein [Candidatus Thermoplasmatota archaeon]